MENLIVQREIPIPGDFRGFGQLGLENDAPFIAPLVFNVFLSRAIGLMTMIAAIWFTFTLISGAISVISSGGDKAKVAEARAKITTGLVGLVIIIAAIFLIELVGALLGFDLILNPAEFIRSLPNAGGGP